jgi:hypothetical protein
MSGGFDLDGLRASVCIFDLEGHLLTRFKRAVALFLDGLPMHEHVGTSLGFNEPEALLGIEPLHYTDGHDNHGSFTLLNPSC